MAIKTTRSRIYELSRTRGCGGTITLEGDHQKEIVVRIVFPDTESGRLDADAEYRYLLEFSDEDDE